jgi:hypothetical protein
VTFENLTKEMKKLKTQEEKDGIMAWHRSPFSNRRPTFSNPAFSNFLAGLGVPLKTRGLLNSGYLKRRTAFSNPAISSAAQHSHLGSSKCY